MRRRSPFIAEPQEDAGRLATEVARLAWPLHRPADLERFIDHIGDARYTDMADEGMFNVGQFVWQRYAAECVFLVGFGSYRGSVIAETRALHPLELHAAMEKIPETFPWGV